MHGSIKTRDRGTFVNMHIRNLQLARHARLSVNNVKTYWKYVCRNEVSNLILQSCQLPSGVNGKSLILANRAISHMTDETTNAHELFDAGFGWTFVLANKLKRTAWHLFA